jgi:hypothetical protein
LNTKIDESFVPMASVPEPEAGKFEEWKKGLVNELRRVSFGYFPETIPAAKPLKGDSSPSRTDGTIQSEQGIEFLLRYPTDRESGPGKMTLLVVLNEDEAGQTPDWLKKLSVGGDQEVVYCEPRGMGRTKWTTKNPPNYVARSHVLLGRTVDAGRVWDIVSAAKYLSPDGRYVRVAGKGPAGLLAAYAAIVAPEIDEVTLVTPPHTHMNDTAPQFLNVLRVCDVPDALGLIAPRRMHIVTADADKFTRTSRAYEAADFKDHLTIGAP